MAKRAIVRCVFDSNVRRLEVNSDVHFAEHPKEITISNGEVTIDFDDTIYVRSVCYPDYETETVKCEDYSLAFRTAWRIDSIKESLEESEQIITLKNSSIADESDNFVIIVTARKRAQCLGFTAIRPDNEPLTERAENIVEPCETSQLCEPIVVIQGYSKVCVAESNGKVEKVIDLAKIPQWNNLPNGEYVITLKAKGKNENDESRTIRVKKS